MVIAGVYHGDESLCENGQTRPMHLDGGTTTHTFSLTLSLSSLSPSLPLSLSLSPSIPLSLSPSLSFSLSFSLPLPLPLPPPSLSPSLPLGEMLPVLAGEWLSKGLRQVPSDDTTGAGGQSVHHKEIQATKQPSECSVQVLTKQSPSLHCW